MSTKVFVHKPLKRYEARRLTEEPKPIEASPRPFVARLEAKEDPKQREARIRRRLAERAARRDQEHDLNEKIEAFVRVIETSVVSARAFIRWLMENLRDRESAGERQAFLDEVNLITVIYEDAPCVVCDGNVHFAYGGSVLVVPEVSSDHPGFAMTGVLCKRCAGLKPRIHARAIVQMLDEQSDECVRRRRLRGCELGAMDYQLLAWANETQRGSDDKAIGRMCDKGDFDQVLRGLEAMQQFQERKAKQSAFALLGLEFSK